MDSVLEHIIIYVSYIDFALCFPVQGGIKGDMMSSAGALAPMAPLQNYPCFQLGFYSSVPSKA